MLEKHSLAFGERLQLEGVGYEQVQVGIQRWDFYYPVQGDSELNHEGLPTVWIFFILQIILKCGCPLSGIEYFPNKICWYMFVLENIFMKSCITKFFFWWGGFAQHYGSIAAMQFCFCSAKAPTEGTWMYERGCLPLPPILTCQNSAWGKWPRSGFWPPNNLRGHVKCEMSSMSYSLLLGTTGNWGIFLSLYMLLSLPGGLFLLTPAPGSLPFLSWASPSLPGSFHILIWINKSSCCTHRTQCCNWQFREDKLDSALAF